MSLDRDTTSAATTSATRPIDLAMAVGMAGVVVGVLGAAGHVALSTGAGPQPAGLYVAALGAAVAALSFIAKAFGPRR